MFEYPKTIYNKSLSFSLRGRGVGSVVLKLVAAKVINHQCFSLNNLISYIIFFEIKKRYDSLS